MTRFVAVFAAGLFLALALPSVPALACSCVDASARDLYNGAHVVFTGRVVDVRLAPVAEEAGPVSRQQTVTFEVRSVYKGSPPANARVRAETDGAACGYAFAESAAYVVFAYARGGEYHTTLCSGTTDDLTYLDRAGFTAREVAMTVPSGAAGPDDPAGARTSWILAAALALALASGAHALRLRARRT